MPASTIDGCTRALKEKALRVTEAKRILGGSANIGLIVEAISYSEDYYISSKIREGYLNDDMHSIGAAVHEILTSYFADIAALNPPPSKFYMGKRQNV